MSTINSRVIGREHNVVQVDFRPQPDPPAPEFPGAGALRPAQMLGEIILETNISKMEAA
jgi:hypothetical protein